MTINELLTKENASTIFVWLWVILGPYLSAYLNQDQFVTLGVIIIGIIGAVYSSRNPNTLSALGNEKTVTVDPTEPVLNPEYETNDGDGA